MYQRIGPPAYKAGLETTISLCKLLGNPQRQYKSIHVAGTNGKGSTCSMLASVLQSAGLKTGLFTSPHLKDFRERIRVNGRMIPKGRVLQFLQQRKSAFQTLNPSFFELTFGLAALYFAEEQVDIAVFEVGMGGRLDSTNVITPLISVITNIGLDHTQFLGSTLAEIGLEKAGIIKEKTPVVIGEYQEETAQVFVRQAARFAAPITFADQVFSICSINKKAPSGLGSYYRIFQGESPWVDHLFCPLGGAYQEKNLLAVAEACRQLELLRGIPSKAQFITGIKKVVSNTGIAGRWQQIGKSPLVLADTGHNVDGITAVIKQISALTYHRLHFVLGLVQEKDTAAVLKRLPREARYYFCKANIPRGLDAQELARAASKMGLEGQVYPSVKEAYQAALAAAGKQDLVFIGGSTFTVAEVL